MSSIFFLVCVFFLLKLKVINLNSNLHFLSLHVFVIHGTLPTYILIRILLSLSYIFFDKTLPPKIKDCQVVQTRISREHGGRDHKTELQVGGVAETQLYKVKTAEAMSS